MFLICGTSQIHEKLKQYEKYSPTPVLHSASYLAEDVGPFSFQSNQAKLTFLRILLMHYIDPKIWNTMVTFFYRQLAEELQNGPLQEDERELLLLLSTPHLKVQTEKWRLKTARPLNVSLWAALIFLQVEHWLHNPASEQASPPPITWIQTRPSIFLWSSDFVQVKAFLRGKTTETGTTDNIFCLYLCFWLSFFVSTLWIFFRLLP